MKKRILHCLVILISFFLFNQTLLAQNPCANSTTLTCAIDYNYSLSGTGVWNPPNGQWWGTPGSEQVFEFTPTLSGDYDILVTHNSSYYVDLLFQSGSCGASGWTYLDDINSSATNVLNLTAGVTYYFLIDDENTNNSSGIINISCPLVCNDNYVNVTVGGGTWDSEISWDIVDGFGTVVASGTAGASTNYCLLDDCYTVNMYDSWGDGWNGASITIDDGAGNILATNSLGSGSSGSFTLYLGLASCPIYGCTDSNAVNYDPLADIDDGSCQASCTAAPYCENFDTGIPANWVNNDWTLDAFGTNSFFTGPSDDITGGGNYMYYETSTGYSPVVSLTSLCLDISALASPGLTFYSHMYGATMGTLEVLVNGTLEWSMSGNQGNQWNLNLVDLSDYAGSSYITIEFVGSYGTSYTGDMAIDEICINELGTLPVYGCTDATAFNYDPAATVDDGSCISIVFGCTDASQFNYDPFANVDDGSCIASVYGCMNTLACNYDVLANVDNSLCILPDGCTDTLYLEYNPSAQCDDGSCVTIVGCTDSTAFNYNFVASFDDGSCVAVAYGCIDNSQSNYNPLANTDDGSCIPFLFGCTNPLAANYNATVNADDGSCIYIGCTDTIADNYDPIAMIDDGSCIYLGCTDPTAFNYDPTSTTDDGSCTPIVLGCSDPNSFNYNSAVNTDDGSCLVGGCTDPASTNYNAIATVDDGSCIYGPSGCAGSNITGLTVSNVIHDRAMFNFDNMNTFDVSGNQICRVDQIRIKYRPVGSSGWSQKNIAQPTGYNLVTGICNSTQNTSKITRNLNSNTNYEWEVKVWYCDGQNTGWVSGPNFTTAADCPNVGSLNAYGATPTKATFTWNNSNGAYAFVRLKARVDSISNPTGADFFQIGGAGVSYGTYTKNKQQMVPGETYRGQSRTYCDPNGGAYRSPAWSSLVYWTQPTVRIEGNEYIAHLDVYPNPSSDVFNISFISENIQDLRVRILNIVGEEILVEDLQQFIGEYTKKISLNYNAKGIYFLEIETKEGIINKKLILQ